MINLTKSLDFFDPIKVSEQIHVIGLGAIGSHVVEQLVRLGITKLYIYDFDEVEPHNIANQIYYHKQIENTKVDATIENCLKINPSIEMVPFRKGYTTQPLSGHIFLCVDSIELRKKITESVQFNTNVKAIFDFRMGLSDAQHYAATYKNIKRLLTTMDFTDDEAKEATPVSACGTTLSVIPTIKMITALGIANFINVTKGEPEKATIIIDAFKPDVLVM